MCGGGKGDREGKQQAWDDASDHTLKQDGKREPYQQQVHGPAVHDDGQHGCMNCLRRHVSCARVVCAHTMAARFFFALPSWLPLSTPCACGSTTILGAAARPLPRRPAGLAAGMDGFERFAGLGCSSGSSSSSLDADVAARDESSSLSLSLSSSSSDSTTWMMCNEWVILVELMMVWGVQRTGEGEEGGGGID